MSNNVQQDLSRVRRIFIRGVNWVGDTVLTFPAVENLRRLFPQAELTVFTPRDLSGLWRAFPHVNEIVPFEKRSAVRSFHEEMELARTLRRRFDLAIIFPRSFHAALLPYMARIPVRIGFCDEGRSFLLTHGIPRTPELLRVHRVLYYLKLIEPLGKVDERIAPKIHLREEDRAWAEAFLKDQGFLDGRCLIGMNPGATYGLAKCWPPDRFRELGKRIAQRGKASILLFGKKEEGSTVQRILGSSGRWGIDLTGKTTLAQLAALLERCQLLVTNDTGTMHVAAAVGTPVVALFGSTDPVTTGPRGNSHVVIRKEVSCTPCLKRVCPTDHRCMDLITVDDVEEAIRQHLRTFSS